MSPARALLAGRCFLNFLETNRAPIPHFYPEAIRAATSVTTNAPPSGNLQHFTRRQATTIKEPGFMLRKTGNMRTRSSARQINQRKRFSFESLENRVLFASDISISDATAIEGEDTLKYIDQFVADGSGGLSVPRMSTFGPDGNGDGVDDLYVASRLTNDILRYDGSTGAFLDTFVPPGSGGLIGPGDLEFGPDGKLYVSSFEGDKVLRYDGQTGAFLDVIADGVDGALGLSFGGSDGALYIATHFGGQVFKYDDDSGLSLFVPPGSGGLEHARQALFGPDGNGDGNEDLYVAGGPNGRVRRYDGLTGAFIDVFATLQTLPACWLEFGMDGYLYVSTDSAGQYSLVRFDAQTGALVDTFLTAPHWAFMFGPDNIIYHSNAESSSIHRLGAASLVVFTVSLSTASASPVTVEFETLDGSAQAGIDYVPTTGTLTFAPGQTSRTILVQTIDNSAIEPNETFNVVLSNPQGATLADGTGVATILDDDAKFYVVNDATADSTYRYDGAGATGASSALGTGNTAPRGAASTAAGDKVWVVDANKTVYVYNAGGGLLGSWTAGGLHAAAQVEGIATNGTDIWIVDAKQDRVYRYAGAASRLSGSQNAFSSFALNSGNKDPKDIVTDGVHLWVVNNSTTDKVFKYTIAGSYLGSWTITSGGGSPTGITIDPSNVSDIWIVDNATDRVY
jgi:hypothetical protein